MKKSTKMIAALAMGAVMAMGAVGFAACKDEQEDNNTAHTHTYSTEWSSDENNHWHAPTCDDTNAIKDMAGHVDEDNDEKCDICNYQLPHKHKYADSWTFDEDYHWHAPTCGDTTEIADKAPHVDENSDYKCDQCNFALHQHTYSEQWSSDENKHWRAPTCSDTTEFKEVAPHVDVDDDDKCDVCNYQLPHKHKYSEQWSTDENNHWHAPTCGDTTELKDKDVHVDKNNDDKCDVCDYDMPAGTPITISAGNSQNIEIDLEVGTYEINFKLGDGVTAVQGGLTSHVNGLTEDVIYDMYEGFNQTYYGVFFVRDDTNTLTLTNTTESEISASYIIKEYKAPTLTADGTEYVVPQLYLPASNNANYPVLSQYRKPLIPIDSSITGNYVVTANYATTTSVTIYSNLDETTVFKLLSKSKSYSATADFTGVEYLIFTYSLKKEFNITVKIEAVE